MLITDLKTDGAVHKETFKIQSSVPQGTHCGPLLFVLMCRDIVDHIQGTGILPLLYADDTKFLRIVNNEEEKRTMQTAIDGLEKWSTINRLKLNPAKTKHVRFTKAKEDEFRTSYFIGTE